MGAEYGRMTTFGICLVVGAALLTGVYGMVLDCTLSSDTNGTVSFRLSPSPDAGCDPIWSTPKGELNGIQYLIAPDKVSMKECLNNLTCRVECVKDGVLSSHSADCSGKCPMAPKQKIANGGLLVAPSACLPVLLACILAIGLLLQAYSESQTRPLQWQD